MSWACDGCGTTAADYPTSVTTGGGRRLVLCPGCLAWARAASWAHQVTPITRARARQLTTTAAAS